MVNVTKRIARIAIAGAAVAVASATLSPAPASAANKIACGNRTDLVKVWWHNEDQMHTPTHTSCYANAGFWSKGFSSIIWTDQLSTGNNRVCVYDRNKDMFVLHKWLLYKPSTAFHMKAFRILTPKQSHCPPLPSN